MNPDQDVDDFMRANGIVVPQTRADRWIAAAKDAAQQFETGFGQGIRRQNAPSVTNTFPQTAGQMAGRYGLPVLGGIAATAASGGMGLIPAVADQALAAAGAEGLGQVAARLAGGNAPTTSGQAALDIGKAAAAAGATEATAGLAGKALVASGAPKLGGQVIQVMTGTPARRGEAALTNPQILSGQADTKTVKEAYNAFEEMTGMSGLGALLKKQGRASMPVTEAEQLLVGTANKVEAGVPVISDPAKFAAAQQAGLLTTEDLYQASQAASHISLAAKYNEPGAARALESGLIDTSKDTVDKALSDVFPEYGPLRNANFIAMTNKDMASILPLNRNLSPNVLRTTAALGGAGTALTGDNPSAAGLALGVSPLAVKTGIKSAYFARKMAPALVGGMANPTPNNPNQDVDDFMRANGITPP